MKLKCVIKVLFLFFPANFLIAQQGALGAGFAGANAWFIEAAYIEDTTISIHLGYSAQPSGASGKYEDVQLSNYGRTIDGSGDYYTSIDLGAGYVFRRTVWTTAGISFGTKSHYTQYLDHRFTDDHYYMTNLSLVLGEQLASFSRIIWQSFCDSIVSLHLG